MAQTDRLPFPKIQTIDKVDVEPSGNELMGIPFAADPGHDGIPAGLACLVSEDKIKIEMADPRLGPVADPDLVRAQPGGTKGLKNGTYGFFMTHDRSLAPEGTHQTMIPDSARPGTVSVNS